MQKTLFVLLAAALLTSCNSRTSLTGATGDTGSSGTGTLSVTLNGTLVSGTTSFGLIPINQESDQTTFTLNNTGSGTLTITSATMTGTDSSSFTVVSYSTSIASGASGTLVAKFNPLTTGTKTANITIASNDSTNPSTNLAVSGATTWGNQFVDGNGTSGINKNTSMSAINVWPATMNGSLYAIWQENNGTAQQIRAAVYGNVDSAPTWTFIDGNGTNGLNKDSTKSAQDPKLAVFNSKLYATWYENSGVAYQIRVKVFNGNNSSPSWSFVDGNGTTGLNKNTTNMAFYPSLFVFNSKLYCAWAEFSGLGDQIRVAVYNGNDSSPSWSFVDGNTSLGLNKDTTHAADYPLMGTLNNKLYITWAEVGSTTVQVRVKVYNGNDSSPSWSFVDGNGTNGLNKNTASQAGNPSLTAFNSKLYLSWYEANGGINQERVAVYNGNDSSPSWSFVDGNGSNGINKNTASNAYIPKMTVFNNRLFSTWYEIGSSQLQTRVVMYNGNDSSPTWSFMDGNGSDGINKDITKSAFMPKLIAHNSKLYALWVEDKGSSINQVRISVAQH